MKLTLMFEMALANQLNMEDMSSEVKAALVKNDWRREVTGALQKIDRDFKDARFQYEKYIEPSRLKCLHDKQGRFDVQMYDDGMRDANEILRLLYLYCDRCFNNFDNVNAVFKFLRSLPSGNIFSEREIEKWRI